MHPMAAYTIIKSGVLTLVVVGALGFFFIRVRHLYRLMMAVEGTSTFRFDHLGRRISVFFTDVIGQRNVRRKPLIGMAHTLILFGFLAIQPHSLELMIRGICPAFDPGRWIPGIYGAYLTFADLLAPLVLLGLGYALYRRLLVRPRYLTMGRDANLIIVFTSLILLTFLLINALQTLLPIPAGGFDYGTVFPVSSRLVTLFDLDALSLQQVVWAYEICYWLHVGTILGFLIYIPGSKHLHLLAAAVNVFLKPLERSKAIAKTDIEDEEAESFGLGKVDELNWKNVLDLYACTECGRCEEQCPASNTGKPLSPKQIVHDFKIDLLDQADAVLAHNGQGILPIMRAGAPLTSDALWACTTCRACEEICPVNIEQLDLIIETRKQRVLMEADFPPELQETFTNLENQANPWGFDNDSRADWCKEMGVPLMTDHPEAEILYYVGCAGSFDDRGRQIARAMVRVLQKAGVDFAVLGPEESCNGDVARRAGNEYLAQMLIQQNVEVLEQYRPRKILTGCPHCYNVIKNEFPQFGGRYPVVHHTEFLFGLFQQGRLAGSERSFGRLTFHDSCYLGRWNGIFDAPRDLLVTFNQGAEPIEMDRSRTQGFCCGAGGARMFMEETMGKRINMERTDEVIASGAGTVATACPFCTTMLRDGLLDRGAAVEVKDVVEIIDQAIG